MSRSYINREQTPVERAPSRIECGDGLPAGRHLYREAPWCELRCYTRCHGPRHNRRTRKVNLMVEVTLMVEYGEHENGVQEYVTITLPGVPRVGETVVTAGALFEVKVVSWHDDKSVSLRVFNTTYGYAFPIPGPPSTGTDSLTQ